MSCKTCNLTPTINKSTKSTNSRLHYDPQVFLNNFMNDDSQDALIKEWAESTISATNREIPSYDIRTMAESTHRPVVDMDQVSGYCPEIYADYHDKDWILLNPFTSADLILPVSTSIRNDGDTVEIATNLTDAECPTDPNNNCNQTESIPINLSVHCDPVKIKSDICEKLSQLSEYYNQIEYYRGQIRDILSDMDKNL